MCDWPGLTDLSTNRIVDLYELFFEMIPLGGVAAPKNLFYCQEKVSGISKYMHKSYTFPDISHFMLSMKTFLQLFSWLS